MTNKRRRKHCHCLWPLRGTCHSERAQRRGISKTANNRDFFGQSPQQHVSHTFEMTNKRRRKHCHCVWLQRGTCHCLWPLRAATYGSERAQRRGISKTENDRDFFGQSPQQHVSHAFEMTNKRRRKHCHCLWPLRAATYGSE